MIQIDEKMPNWRSKNIELLCPFKSAHFEIRKVDYGVA